MRKWHNLRLCRPVLISQVINGWKTKLFSKLFLMNHKRCVRKICWWGTRGRSQSTFYNKELFITCLRHFVITYNPNFLRALSNECFCWDKWGELGCKKCSYNNQTKMLNWIETHKIKITRFVYINCNTKLIIFVVNIKIIKFI